LERLWIFCHPRFQWCHWIDNRVDNHRVDNLTKNPQNKLSHTSFSIYPPRPLNNPPSTMHKWKVVGISCGEKNSSTQSRKHQKLEDNGLKWIATWHFSWNTQWHTLIMFLWIRKYLAWKSISRSWSISFL
jgi:hypothetical protein